jgi:hypothetical protein
MRYRLELRLTAADIGERVVLRWRRPAEGGGEEVADVLGILEAADHDSFTVRKSSGEVVVIPWERALGGKTVPPAPAARRRRRNQLSRGSYCGSGQSCPARGPRPHTHAGG